jgi:hypothetical protein
MGRFLVLKATELPVHTIANKNLLFFLYRGRMHTQTGGTSVSSTDKREIKDELGALNS